MTDTTTDEGLLQRVDQLAEAEADHLAGSGEYLVPRETYIRLVRDLAAALRAAPPGRSGEGPREHVYDGTRCWCGEYSSPAPSVPSVPLDERLKKRCTITGQASMQSHKDAYWLGYHDARNALRSLP